LQPKLPGSSPEDGSQPSPPFLQYAHGTVRVRLPAAGGREDSNCQQGSALQRETCLENGYGRGLDNDKASCRSHGRGRFWSSMDASIKTSASTMTKPGYRHMGRLGVGGCVHPRPSHDNDKPGLCTAGWTLVNNKKQIDGYTCMGRSAPYIDKYI